MVIPPTPMRLSPWNFAYFSSFFLFLSCKVRFISSSSCLLDAMPLAEAGPMISVGRRTTVHVDKLGVSSDSVMDVKGHWNSDEDRY